MVQGAVDGSFRRWRARSMVAHSSYEDDERSRRSILEREREKKKKEVYEILGHWRGGEAFFCVFEF